MVLREERDALAAALGRLVAGEMTNDEFDDAWLERWDGSSDVVVAQIAEFGRSLYSSDVIFAYRLKGRHSVSADERQMASRAIAFLNTDREYPWPTNFERPIPYWTLWGPAFGQFIGLMFLAAILAANESPFAVIIGGLVCFSPTLLWFATRRCKRLAWQKFLASGDFEVWPLLSRTELADAAEAVEPTRE